jgi:phage tail-like protein
MAKGPERPSLEPIPGFRFAVQIGEGGDRAAAGWFTECSGLTIERTLFTHQEGGVNAYVHQLPDRIKHTNITLKRGVGDAALWRWFAGEGDAGLYEGKVEYRNVTIILYNVDRTEAMRWNVDRAYPVKWNGPSLQAGGNQVAIETLELVHHGISLVPGQE